MDYTLLKDMLVHLEDFQRESRSDKVEDFTVWLTNRLFAEKPDGAHSTHDELLIAFKVMLLHKELKKQSKPILSASGLSSVDEYSFLLHLAHGESFRKMEIIDMHHLEAPTGTEIIKRLLKHKLVEEFPDAEDKRARRIRITKKGRKEVHTLQPAMEQVFTQFTDALNLNEKVRLSGILDKLIR